MLTQVNRAATSLIRRPSSRRLRTRRRSRPRRAARARARPARGGRVQLAGHVVVVQERLLAKQGFPAGVATRAAASGGSLRLAWPARRPVAGPCGPARAAAPASSAPAWRRRRACGGRRGVMRSLVAVSAREAKARRRPPANGRARRRSRRPSAAASGDVGAAAPAAALPPTVLSTPRRAADASLQAAVRLHAPRLRAHDARARTPRRRRIPRLSPARSRRPISSAISAATRPVKRLVQRVELVGARLRGRPAPSLASPSTCKRVARRGGLPRRGDVHRLVHGAHAAGQRRRPQRGPVMSCVPGVTSSCVARPALRSRRPWTGAGATRVRRSRYSARREQREADDEVQQRPPPHTPARSSWSRLRTSWRST